MKKFYSFLVIAAVMASVAIPGSVFALSTASVDVQASTNNNNEQIRAQISALMAQIESLRSQLKENQGQNKPFMVSEAARPVSVSASGSFCYDFNANMSSRGALGKEDITALNTVLAKEGLATLDAQPVFSEQAVKNYQARYADEVLRPVGLSEPTGFVGAATRAKLNRMYGCTNKPMMKPTEVVRPTNENTKYGLFITYPNGGETLELGKTYVATFDANIPLASKMLVYLGREYDKSSFKYKPGAFNSTALLGCLGYQDGVGFEQGGCGVPTNVWGNVADKSFKFVIPSYMTWMGLGDGFRLMVCDEACSESAMKDISDNSFTITKTGSVAYPLITTTDQGVSVSIQSPTVQKPIQKPLGGVYADVTGDGLVNTNDLLAVINTWGPCASAPTCTADINTDKMVNGMDLDLVIKYWTK